MTTIRIRQTASPIRRPAKQKAVLVGLGLRGINHVVEVKDTAEVRGAIAKVAHMVEVVS